MCIHLHDFKHDSELSSCNDVFERMVPEMLSVVRSEYSSTGETPFDFGVDFVRERFQRH